MEYMTSVQAAEKWNLSKRQVNSLCSRGTIPGALKSGNRWMIPENAVYQNRKNEQKNQNLLRGKYLNIGNEGFQSIRNGEYVDKSGLISFMNACLDTPQKLVCVSRPRRFGKSFATKMLCAYYSKACDSRKLFEDLKIAEDPSFEQHLNRHQVLYLDITLFLSMLKRDEQFVEQIEREVIGDLARIYPELGTEKRLFDALCRMNQITGERLILIIDEWDAMFRECKGEEKILDQYILLLRSLFKSSLTDQLFAGVYMTGILPIKKYGHESAVSDFYEYSMVEPRPLQEYIGFTEEEVEVLCKKHGKDYAVMKEWYDGYFVGGSSIYNPKSVMEAILRNKYGSYWTKTETYEALRDYIDMNFDGLKDAVVDMLGGAYCEVDTGSFQNDMTSMKSRDDVLTLLIHLGYLSYNEDRKCVTIPNIEIREEFLRAIKNGNRTELMKAIQRSDAILAATWESDGAYVAELVDEIHNEDTASVFYNNEQALRSVIKMAYLSSMDYYVKAEEIPAGKGIADIVFFPKKGTEKPVLIVELKWNKTEQKALNQILDRKYVKILKEKEYDGKVLLVGINYSEKTKEHSCIIKETFYNG